jgi:hypothetical protein
MRAVRFPEDQGLVRVPGNEKYLGLQLVLGGFNLKYVPDNPVLYIKHESLSRGVRIRELRAEIEIIRREIARLLGAAR